MSLQFKFQEMLTEIDALAGVARGFIEPGHNEVFDQLSTVLKNIRDDPTNKTYEWGIKENYPLRTRVSYGEYQGSCGGQHNVFAEITSVWEIRRIKPSKRSAPAERFELTGLASTRVRLMEVQPGADPAQIAMWRMEIGDASSPGCHFHVQVLGEAHVGQFPRSLDVPRLPGLVATPPAVIEFVVGELFQKEWPKHIAGQSAKLQRWAPIQRNRLSAVLGWHSKIVCESSGSPWTTLKGKKPPDELFC